MIATVKHGLVRSILVLRGRGGVLSELRRLRAAESLTAVEIQQAETDALRRLLNHCYNHVPYYRRLLEQEGWSSDLPDEAMWDVFHRMPILTKDLIRENFEDLRSDDLSKRKWYYNTSGGSTGEPVRFIQDARYAKKSAASKQYYDSWTGYKVGMPKVVLWGSERDLLVGNETWRTRVGRWLRGELWLNTFRMNANAMREHVHAINRHKPVQILAYVESIYELARFIEREGLSVHSPKSIMTSAGTLHLHMRDTITRVFRAPVFNRYGSREVGDVGSQRSPSSPLFIPPMTHLVEIVDPQNQHTKAGDVGRILVTLLTNYAMPLVRFDIGDRGAFHSSPGDLKFKALNQVEGRSNSIIRTSTAAVDSVALSALLYYRRPNEVFQSFSKYQLVQTHRDVVEFRVEVHDPAVWVEEKKIVTRKLSEALGPQTALRLCEVQSLEPSKSGKHIYIWSEIE